MGKKKRPLESRGYAMLELGTETWPVEKANCRMRSMHVQ